MRLDLADGYVIVGSAALVLGLVLVHPALVLAVIGYVALRHGLARSR